MRTEIKALIDNIESSNDSIKNISGYSHTSDDISMHLKVAGAALERFLKDAVYNALNTRDRLVDLINGLSNFGVTQPTLDAFNALRLLYNESKHNASFVTNFTETSKALEQVIAGLKELQIKNISNVNRQFRPQHNRVLWLSAWDHYTSGETEISIFLPQVDTLFPTAIEHFNIKYTGWNEIVSKYVPANELVMGKSYLPEEVYNFWSNEGDFVGAGLFNGDLRELVFDLSKHIDFATENRLLPGLKREEDFPSVKSAVVFSLLDAFKDNYWDSLNSLKDELFLRASYDYGINITSKYLNVIINKVSPLLNGCDRNELKSVDEVLWVNKHVFLNQKVRIEVIADFDVILNEDNKIVCNLE